MMKRILFLLLSMVSFYAQAQTTTTINGYIKNEKNQPLEGVTVMITESKSSTMTDAKGFFSFQSNVQGRVTLKAVLIGHTVFTHKLNVSADKNEPLNFILTPSDETLQTVEITGRKEKNYKNSVSYGGTKTAAEIKDVPQSIQYITKELMQDQGAVRMTDVVKNVSGVNQYTFYDDVSIRGFRNQGGLGSSSSNQLFNGLRTFNGFWRQNLLNYLERVEIIKGPASALFGNANPGGTINKVTKKPLDTNLKSINFQVGS